MNGSSTEIRTKRTPKQRVLSRHRTAYCKRHFDVPLWCVFLRRDDAMALVCERTVHKAWTEAWKRK